MKNIIKNRIIIQGIIGLTIYVSLFVFNISLKWIVLAGIITGIFMGKAFCRWICPIGFFMEILFSKKDDKSKQLYMYYKGGCPIAWINGILNRYSLFKIKRDINSCNKCGKCDNVCYIASLNNDYSLYRDNKKEPFLDFKCSKCLECIKECPNNSLKLEI
jgi:polyferredoxin